MLPPTPTPDTKRISRKLGNSWLKEDSSPATAFTNIALISTRLRPRESPSEPQT